MTESLPSAFAATAEHAGPPAPNVAYPSPSEHYRLLIEDARALGDRRETINNLFVGLISLIAGGQGYILIAMPGRLAGLAVSLAAAAFGLGLCWVWRDVLGTYKLLLDMRYSTLKLWEDRYSFPSLRKYYISEDVLYGDLSTPTELSQSVPSKLRGKASKFVNVYKWLPRMAILVFCALTIFEGAAFFVVRILPHISLTLPF